MTKKPIRVLQVIGVMNRGGAETMIMNLYRHIDREKVQFDFVENAGEKAAYDEEIRQLGGRIFRCPRFRGINLADYKKWWQRFFDEHAREYRIVHGHIGSTASFYLQEAKKHGLVAVAHSHNTNGPLSVSSLLYRALSQTTRSIADYFFGCSIQAGIDRYGAEIVRNGDRFLILNNAVDTAQFAYDTAARTQSRAALNYRETDFVIGHAGRFMEQKNHAYLLDIFLEISRLAPDARLLLVGDGPLREKTRQKAETLGIVDKVTFTGVRADVAELMQAMDVLLFPSKNEGLPVTLVEAQTSGLPCVISDRIPGDSILCDDLVTVCSLEESPAFWARKVLETKNTERRDHSREVNAAGFDINETAKWLEAFYLEKAEQ